MLFKTNMVTSNDKICNNNEIKQCIVSFTDREANDYGVNYLSNNTNLLIIFIRYSLLLIKILC